MVFLCFQFQQNFLSDFYEITDWEAAFVENWCTNFSLKLSVSIVGEIERYIILHRKQCCCIFLLCEKVWWNWPEVKKKVEKNEPKSFVRYLKEEEAKGQKTYRALSLSGVRDLFFKSDNFKKNCNKKCVRKNIPWANWSLKIYREKDFLW